MKNRFNSIGWLDSAIKIETPNYNDRPEGVNIILGVIHSASLPAGKYNSDDLIMLVMNKLDISKDISYESLRNLKVSAHFFIRRDSSLIQFVPVLKRAWHAGISSWRGLENCNDFSVGIELEGTAISLFTDKQYKRLNVLAKALEREYGIKYWSGHSDIASGRKTDPGIGFYWDKFRKKSV